MNSALLITNTKNPIRPFTPYSEAKLIAPKNNARKYNHFDPPEKYNAKAKN